MAASDNEKAPIMGGPGGGDPAFEEMIRENQRMIHSLCYRMTGSLADADDLAQETFLRAYQHLDRFRGEARVSSWLYRIALNQCLNWRKQRERRKRLHEDWSALDRAPAGGDSGRAAQIQGALMRLHPKQRAAVVLTTYDGLTHAEAARVLGCSEPTISWRLFAARRRLKGLLRRLAGPGGSL